MEKVQVGDQVYGSDGQLCNVTFKTDIQPNLNFYRVTLRDGRSVEVCEDHLWKVWDKNKNKTKQEDVWSVVSTKDMYTTYYNTRIGQKSSGKEYRYALPVAKALNNEDLQLNHTIHPYIVGVLLGDGSLTSENISFHTRDLEIVDTVNELLPQGYIAQSCNSNPHDYKILMTDDNVSGRFSTLCKNIEIFGHRSWEKFIPKQYKYMNSNDSLWMLKGLMDTDGTSNKKGVIEY
jgi:hypothetical protein